MTAPTAIVRTIATRRRRVIAVAVACAALAAGWRSRSSLSVAGAPEARCDRGERDVPLGVEEAVIIRYCRPAAGRPAVSPRGLGQRADRRGSRSRAPSRVYDMRYVVSLPGEFDLMEYLTSADGSPLDDLPPFKVRGADEPDEGHRDADPRDRGRRRPHLALVLRDAGRAGRAVGAWLVGLIFIGRPKRPPQPAPPPPEPSLAELIARYLAALARGDLSVDDKARLEILLLRHWRERLSLRHDRMAAACRQIRRDGTVGQAYEAVEAWLHDPSRPDGAGGNRRSCAPR